MVGGFAGLWCVVLVVGRVVLIGVRAVVIMYVALARQPPLPGWWRLYSDLVAQGEWFREYGPLEDQASTLSVFENTLIPGLLQTEDYARVLLSARRPEIP